MEIIPYTCIRCGYKVKHKSCMIKHLYNRQKKCPDSGNDIELNDEIKEKILENRVYYIPKEKKEIKRNINKILDANEGCIYLFYTRACKNGDENVYKIGKTGDYIKRKTQYDKGGDMLFVVNVKHRHDSEFMILQAFKEEFIQRKDYGTEYFQGDIYEMILMVNEILEDQINNVIIDYTSKAFTIE